MFQKFGFEIQPMFLYAVGDLPGGKVDDDDDSPARRKDPVVTAAKYNSDVTTMARHINELEDDNYTIRGKNRKLAEANKTLESRVPEGGVVLSKEDAAAWEEYKKLGKPKELQTVKEENETLKKKDAENARSTTLRELVDAVEPGVKFDFDVFKDLDSRLVDVAYEKKIVKEDGQDVTKWFVKYKEGEGSAATTKEATVTEFFKTKFPKYMDVLQTPNTSNTIQGTAYPEQPAGGQAPKAGNMAANYVSDRYGHSAPDKSGQLKAA